jgi:hypothetical protein
VIDADALSLMGDTINAPAIMTPHRGEFARLFGDLPDAAGSVRARRPSHGSRGRLKGSNTSSPLPTTVPPSRARCRPASPPPARATCSPAVRDMLAQLRDPCRRLRRRVDPWRGRARVPARSSPTISPRRRSRRPWRAAGERDRPARRAGGGGHRRRRFVPLPRPATRCSPMARWRRARIARRRLPPLPECGGCQSSMSTTPPTPRFLPNGSPRRSGRRGLRGCPIAPRTCPARSRRRATLHFAARGKASRHRVQGGTQPRHHRHARMPYPAARAVRTR